MKYYRNVNFFAFLKYHAIVISFKNSFNLIICNLKKKPNLILNRKELAPAIY